MLIDLSHRLEPGMPSYPGLPEPRFHTFLAHGDAAKHAHYAPGTSFQIAAYELGGNTGTYVDAPFHRYLDGADLADVPLDRLADLPGVVFAAPGDGPIEARVFSGIAVRGKAVLVHTGWAKHWGSSGYFRSGPFLTASACEHLVHAGAALVGIDCANIDNMQDPARPAHSILLKAGIPIVEHLRGLEQLSGREFRVFAAPPAIRGGTSFPVRALAVCE
ncbi:MAG TPA: cyclase family protein [Terriglobales bacterium]|jgi:kynurenine formamidase|nr:cyclase family protein [Terriglobales bacterium]